MFYVVSATGKKKKKPWKKRHEFLNTLLACLSFLSHLKGPVKSHRHAGSRPGRRYLTSACKLFVVRSYRSCHARWWQLAVGAAVPDRNDRRGVYKTHFITHLPPPPVHRHTPVKTAVFNTEWVCVCVCQIFCPAFGRFHLFWLPHSEPRACVCVFGSDPVSALALGSCHRQFWHLASVWFPFRSCWSVILVSSWCLCWRRPPPPSSLSFFLTYSIHVAFVVLRSRLLPCVFLFLFLMEPVGVLWLGGWGDADLTPGSTSGGFHISTGF